MRQIMTRPELRDYLAEHHPEDLAFSKSVLAESEGKAAGWAALSEPTSAKMASRHPRRRLPCATRASTSS
jgi:hypothetical protein